jgi:hypothetical protein
MSPQQIASNGGQPNSNNNFLFTTLLEEGVFYRTLKENVLKSVLFEVITGQEWVHWKVKYEMSRNATLNNKVILNLVDGGFVNLTILFQIWIQDANWLSRIGTGDQGDVNAQARFFTALNAMVDRLRMS